jgi:membrane dipeptidase
MNRLGMMVDISHVADKTFFDALEVSTAPMIASHSSCRALTGFTRNMTDEMIRGLAAKGGVININFGCDFLSQRYYDESKSSSAELKAKRAAAEALKDSAEKAAALAALKEEPKVAPATLGDLVAHIDHAVKIAGIDHVGIGTDFDGLHCVPLAVDSYNKFPVLTRALLEKGYTAEDIKKIYGGNMLRVMRAVAKRADELKTEPPIETAYKP